MATYQKPVRLEIKNEDGEWSLLGEINNIDYFVRNICEGTKHDIVFDDITADPKKTILRCRICGFTGSLELIGVQDGR